MARRDSTEGTPRAPYALRLGDDERRVLEAAAAQRRIALSTYVRRSALETARRDLAGVEA